MYDTSIINFVLGAYLVVMLGVGIASARFVKSSEDFIIGGRKIPWWVAGTSVYMSAFSAFTFVADAGNAYTHGMVGALINAGPVLGWLVVGLLTAAKWHRLGIVTPVEYLELRFGPGMRIFYAWLSLVFSTISIATRLFAFSILASTILQIPVSHVILISGLLIACYSLMGGLWAVVMTDIIQFIILAIGLIPLLVMSVIEVGGITGFNEMAASDVFAWSKSDRGLTWLIGWWGIEIINALFRFEGIQRFTAVPSENSARKSAFLASALLVPTLITALIPVFIAAHLIPDISGEQAFASMVSRVLPPGLVGLIMGAMFAATISALDSELNVSAGIISRDIYRRFMRKKSSDRELLFVGRISTMLLAVLSVAFALGLAWSQTGVFEWAEFIASRFLVIPLLCFVLGLFLTNTSSLGFCFSLICGFTVSLVLWILDWSPSSVRFPVVTTCIVSMILANTIFPGSAEDRSRSGRFRSILASPGLESQVAKDSSIDFQIFKILGTALMGISLIPLSLVLVIGSPSESVVLECITGLFTLMLGFGILLFSWRRMQN